MFYLLTLFLLAQDGIAPVTSQAGGSSFGSLLWAFLNSSLGLTIVVGMFTTVMAKIATVKPEWFALFVAHKGAFFDAVRYAEKAIPDDSPNVNLLRADSALKFILRLEHPELSKADESALRSAITKAH